MKEIEIAVNGQSRKLLPTNINSLLESLNIKDTSGLALAINNEVIPKTNWQEHKIKDGDKIILVSATQGG